MGRRERLLKIAAAILGILALVACQFRLLKQSSGSLYPHVENRDNARHDILYHSVAYGEQINVISSLWTSQNRSSTTRAWNSEEATVSFARAACQHGPRTSRLVRPASLYPWTRQNFTHLPGYNRNNSLEYWDNVQKSGQQAGSVEARCAFNAPASIGRHFAHALQNLYSCWSYWQFRIDHHHQQQPQQQYGLQQAGSIWQQWLGGQAFSVRPVLYYPPDYQDLFDVEEIRMIDLHRANGLKGILRFLYDWGVEFRPITMDDSRSTTAVRPRLFSNATMDGFAMQSSRHATRLHNTVLDALQLRPSARDCANNLPHITILNRKGTRRFLHVHAIRDALEHAIMHKNTHHVRIPIVYFDDASFATQIAVMSQTDILISPHGAQLSTVPFLRDCGTVLEIFPFRYCLPFFYGSLATSSGLSYAYLYMGNVCMWEKVDRGQRRAANLCLNVDMIVQSVMQLVEEWKARCCGKTCAQIEKHDT